MVGNLFFQTFPKASLTQFLQMILEALPKAAFHVKAEICQVNFMDQINEYNFFIMQFVADN